jgi:hypothetical protein
MDTIVADISAILAIGAATGTTFLAQAGRGTMELARKLATARIDRSRARQIRIFTVII